MNKPKRKIKFSIKNNKLTFTVEGVKGRMCFGGGYGSCDECQGKYCPLYTKGKCACDEELEDEIGCILPCEDIKDAAQKLGMGWFDACPRKFVKEAKLKTPVKELHFTATAEEEYHEDE